MADVKLLIDQGNTRLKWVLAKDDEIDESSAGQGDLEAFMQAFRRETSIHPGSVLYPAWPAGKKRGRWWIFVNPGGA